MGQGCHLPLLQALPSKHLPTIHLISNLYAHLFTSACLFMTKVRLWRPQEEMWQRAVCFQADTMSKADADIKELVKKPTSDCTWNPDVEWRLEAAGLWWRSILITFRWKLEHWALQRNKHHLFCMADLHRKDNNKHHDNVTRGRSQILTPCF